MIMAPDWITEDMLQTAVNQVASKKNEKSTNTIRLEKFNEGTCAQVLHIGAYAEEGPVLKKMHDEFIPENGYKRHGKHHEIYFSDFRKTAPEKLRTILRQPVEAQSSLSQQGSPSVKWISQKEIAIWNVSWEI